MVDRLSQIHHSPVFSIAERAEELRRTGAAVINMAAGRPDFRTPSHIVEAAKQALDDGFTGYTEGAGTINLRRAIAAKLLDSNAFTADPEAGIVVTVGAREAIFSTVLSLVTSGDEVILTDTCYQGYGPAVSLAGALPRYVSFDPLRSPRIDIAELEAAVNSRTKAVLLNTPHNPTGAVLSAQELANIANVCNKYGLYAVIDEIYQDFVYDGLHHTSMASLPESSDRVITINGFSKSYAMTGWRVGYVAAGPIIASRIKKVHGHIVTCATSFAQRGAEAALVGSQESVEKSRSAYERRRDALVKGLSSVPGIRVAPPEGAFYVFARFHWNNLTSSQVAEELLSEAAIAVVPGGIYGEKGEGFVRMALTVPDEQIEEAIFRIGKVAANLA